MSLLLSSGHSGINCSLRAGRTADGLTGVLVVLVKKEEG